MALTLFLSNVNEVIAPANDTGNDNLVDVIGNKADVANRTTAQASIIGLLRQLDSDVTTISGSLGAANVITGTADSGTAGTLVDAALTQTSDYFNGQLLLMTSGNNVGLSRAIVDFDAASDTVFVEPDFPNAISTDTYIILPRNEYSNILIGNNNNNNEADTSNVVANANGSILERQEYIATQLLAGGDIHDVLYADATGASLAVDIATIDGIVDNILVDTNELQTDWANGGRLDLILDELTVQGDTNETKIDTIDTVVDTINTNVGDPSGDNLISITAKIGDSTTDLVTLIGTPVTDISTDIANVKTVVDETNGYLEAGGDVYNALITDAAGANIAADIIVIDGIVDTIAAENSSSDSSGTFSYLDAGAEQDVVEVTNTTRKIINAVWVDCINLTNNGTFKLYYKVDGTNYREITDLAYTITAGTTEAINLLSNAGNLGITEDFKVTYEEAGDEGAARDIPYSLIYETKE